MTATIADHAVGRMARRDARSGDTAAAPAEDRHPWHAGNDAGAPQAEVVMIKEHDEGRQRRGARPTARRLGAVECMLLALIALGVAITGVMAIVNP
jgi:hypothetical protein